MSANHFHYTGFFNTPRDAGLAKQKLDALSLDEKINILDLTYLIDDALNLEEISVSETAMNIYFETGTSGEIDIDLLIKLKPLNIEFVKVTTFFDQVGESETEFFFRGQAIEGDALDTLLSQFDPTHHFFHLLEENEFGQASKLMGIGSEVATFVDKNKVLHKLAEEYQFNLFNFALEQGANPNVVSDDEVLLQYLVERQNVEDIHFIKSLLEHNAKTDFAFSEGGSFLWHLYENHAPLAATLANKLQLLAPVDVNSDNLWDQISVAIVHHDNETALKLLAETDIKDDQVSSLLSDAVRSDNSVIYKYFNEHNPDILNAQKLELFEAGIHGQSVNCCAELLPLIINDIDLEEEFETITDSLSASAFATNLLETWLSEALAREDNLEIDNFDAINKAIKYQCYENLRILLNGNINFTSDESPLHDLVHDLTPISLEIMTNAGYKLESKNYEGQTFIEFAIEKLDPRNPILATLMASFNDKPLEEKVWFMLQADNLAEFKALHVELADKNIVNEQGNSLLMQAIVHNAEHCLAYLFTQNPDIKNKNILGNTALSLAVIAGNLNWVTLLLDLGADANDKVCFAEEDNEDDEDEENAEAMMSLLGLDGLDAIGEIKEAIDEVLTIEGNDSSCLMMAATNGYLQICETLLANNAQVNDEDEEGNNALYYAVRNGHLDVFNLLLSKGIKIKNDSEGDSLLITANYHQHTHMIRPLVEAGIDINQKSSDSGETAICTSAAFGALYERDQVSILIELGADINIPSKSGNTPLMYCCENLNPVGAELLLKAGADTNAVNKEGNTAYDYYLQNQEQFELNEPDRLQPTKKLIGLNKTVAKIKRFILKSLLPVAIIWALIAFFSTTYATYFLYLVVAWWTVKLYCTIKSRFEKPEAEESDAPMAKVGEVFLNVMAEAAEKEKQKKEKMKQWEDD